MRCNPKPWRKHSRDANKQALQAALRRLSEDEFGYGMECGEEIEEARLLANPAVQKFVACLKS
jgi:DnaK suppressor protein